MSALFNHFSKIPRGQGCPRSFLNQPWPEPPAGARDGPIWSSETQEYCSEHFRWINFWKRRWKT